MFQIIPSIGTIIALAAFFFALYFRTVQKYAQVGIDSVRSVGQLPAKSRLDATKVLVNVFDLDVDNLTSDQQFELAKKTFEKRESDSKRNFFALIGTGLVFLLFAFGYAVSHFDGATMIKSALELDHFAAEAALREKGYYNFSDRQLVDNLARIAAMPKIDDPFVRAEKFTNLISSQPTVQELRDRAARDMAPFQIAGEIFSTSVPSRVDQPPRYIAYVKRNSPLSGSIISISAKGRSQSLKLLARDGIENSSGSDLQLNYEQFKEVFGSEPNNSRNTLVLRSSSRRVYDPTCPKYQGFSTTVCDLSDEVGEDEIALR